MIRRLDPFTWLLVTLAAWALACVGVALTGFGGHYQLLPDNPTLVKPPPAVASASTTHATMGALEVYAEAYNHPLFFPDRKPAAAHVPGKGAQDSHPLDVLLTSVIMTPTLQMAIVQDPKAKQSLRVRQGQPIGGPYGGWKLTGLSPRSATFDGGSQGETTLDLRVFDGKGGEEPTRTGLTPQVVASGALGPPRPRMDVGDGNNNANTANTDDGDANGSDTQNDTATANPTQVSANQANAAAASAAQQAEAIRRRIEQRRQQVQAQNAANKKER